MAKRISPFKYTVFYATVFFLPMNANGLALGEEADFEALNYQPSTKVDTR